MKPTLAIGVLAIAAMLPSANARSESTQLDPDRGLEIMNRSCTSCHEIRAIEIQAFDSDGWIATLNRMIDNGAEIETIDQLILLDYLVRNHGPVPEGAGKELLLNRCTICHNLSRVRAHRGTRVLWEDALQAMRNEGAFLTDSEYAIMVDYLSESFGPQD